MQNFMIFIVERVKGTDLVFQKLFFHCITITIAIAITITTARKKVR